MGRPTIYNSAEERMLAARAARQRYYDRNRVAISKKMKVKYKARHVQAASALHTDDVPLTKEQRKTTSSGRNVHRPENELQAVEGELLGLVSGSLKSLLDGLLSAPDIGQTLNDTIEDLILQVADIQTSARDIESKVLRCWGIGAHLATAQKITGRIATAISILEDVLMASMEGNVVVLYRSEALLYQKETDVSYGNAIFHHKDNLSSAIAIVLTVPSLKWHPSIAFRTHRSSNPHGRPPAPYAHKFNNSFFLSTCCTHLKKKMGGHDWATDEQKKWLHAYYKEHYVKCLPSRDYTEFKPVFFSEWFKRWPEVQSKECGFPPGTTCESLTPVQSEFLKRRIEKRHEQLLGAMRWKANVSRMKRAASVADPFKSMKRLTKETTKKTRNLTEEQVFSKMYYEEDVKPKYEAECARLGVATKAKSERMGIRRRLTKEAWDERARNEEERRKVLEEKARREAEMARVKSTASANAVTLGVTGPSHNSEMKVKAVRDLPAMLVKLLDNFKDNTDWSFTILAGGPANGKVKTFSIHVGETLLGMNFTQSHSAFNEQVMQPFDSFVRHVHAGSVQPSQGSQDVRKSPNPPTEPVAQLGDSLISNHEHAAGQFDNPSASASGSAQTAHGYHSDTDISMRSYTTGREDDDVSIHSDVSMHSQWSFNIDDDPHMTPDSPPPHGVYLPLTPYTGTSAFLPPLLPGHSFLDELSDTSRFDVPLTHSDTGSSRRTSVSSSSSHLLPASSAVHAPLTLSAGSGHTGTPLTTQNTQVMPGFNIFEPTSAWSSGVMQGVSSATAIYGGNVMGNPPTSFVRNTAVASNPSRSSQPPAFRTTPIIPSSVPTNSPTTLAPCASSDTPQSTATRGITNLVSPAPAPPAVAPAPTSPAVALAPTAPPAVAPAPTPAPTPTQASAPIVSLATPTAAIAPTPSMVASTPPSSKQPSPAKKKEGKRAQAQSTSASDHVACDMSGSGLRRSGRSTVPSTRNTVADQIGGDHVGAHSRRGRRNN